MKRYFGIYMLACFIFLAASVSAFEFDNVATYGSNLKGVPDMVVTIHNAFNLPLLTSEIGTVELKSHKTPTQVLKVGYGKEEVVMYYDFTNWKDIYKNGLGKVTFTDMRTGDQIDKNYTFVYWGEKTRDVYKYVNCTTDKSGHEQCDLEKTGTENYYDWIPYNSTDIPNHNIRIGLKTYVSKDDYIDGVWTIAGDQIQKHASWTASLNVDLISYYNFDNVTDPVSNHDLSVLEGSPVFNSTSCLIGSCGWVTSGNHWKIADNSDFDFAGTSDGTINVWVHRSTLTTFAGIFDKYAGGGAGWYWQFDDTSGRVINDYLGSTMHGTENVAIESWTMLTLTFNSTNGCLWINGTINVCTARRTTVASSSPIGVGSSDTGTDDLDGILDEAGFWNRTLSDAEVTQLYNGGSGITYDANPTTPPTITLNEPSNSTTVSNPTVVFNLTASDNSQLDNISLIINNSYVTTNSSPINNTKTSFTYTLSSTGLYTWNGEACDDEDTCTNASAYQIWYNNSLNITLNSPINYYNSTTSSNVFSCTPSDDTAVLNTSLILDDAYNETNSTGLNNTAINFTKSIADGDHTWNCEVCDVYACLNGTARNFTVDSTPPVVSDDNITDVLTYSLPATLIWNYSASDTHLDNCYWNSTDNSSYSIVTCNSPISTLFYSEGNKTIQYCANDTFGFESCGTAYSDVTLLNVSQSESPDPVGVGDVATFILNLNSTDIPSSTATLTFNNTLYSATTVTTDTDGYIFEADVTVPEGWGNTTGITQDWYWNYSISGIATNESTSTQNVTVFSLALDNCSSYGDLIFNMTLNAEESGEMINTTQDPSIELDINISSRENSSISVQYSQNYTNSSYAEVCVPTGLINNSKYRIDIVGETSADSRAVEFFYLDNGTLNSSSYLDQFTNKTYDAYDLLLDDSTTFLFTFLDEDNVEVPNAIVHVFRQYIGEGLFREVERGKQDDNGETHIHLVEEDVIYYFKVSLNGELLYTSSTYNAKCLSSPCQIELSASSPNVEFDTNFTGLDGTYSLVTYPSERTIGLVFSLIDPAEMNLTILKEDYQGSFTSVNSSTVTSTGSTINLSIPQTAGNVTFYAIVYKDGEFVTYKLLNLQDAAYNYFGATGLIMASFTILTLVLMGVFEGAGVIVMLILALVLTAAMKVINLGYYSLVGLICALIILIFKLTKKRRRA